MAKKKIAKLTPEELAQHELHQQWVRDRIAYHEAKAREQDEARERKESS